MCTSASKATFTAFGFVECLDRLPFKLCNRCDDELGDACVWRDRIGGLTEVDQDDLDLSAIIGIDGTWCVEHGQAMLPRESTAWSHLRFETIGERERDPCGDEFAFHGLKCHRCLYVCEKIDTCRLWCLE